MKMPAIRLAGLLLAVTTAFAQDAPKPEAVAAEATPSPAPATAPQVEVKTSAGSFVIELNKEKAPVTVKNFLSYVEKKHYDGTVFHRVIDSFMIQGGGFEKKGDQLVEKSTDAPIKNEAGNGLKNSVGTVAMARTNQPDSATAQFFVNVADNDFLNFSPQSAGYAVFGKVVKGMDVVNQIKNVKTAERPLTMNAGKRSITQPSKDVPVSDVVIESIRVVEAK